MKALLSVFLLLCLCFNASFSLAEGSAPGLQGQLDYIGYYHLGMSPAQAQISGAVQRRYSNIMEAKIQWCGVSWDARLIFDDRKLVRVNMGTMGITNSLTSTVLQEMEKRLYVPFSIEGASAHQREVIYLFVDAAKGKMHEDLDKVMNDAVATYTASTHQDKGMKIRFCDSATFLILVNRYKLFADKVHKEDLIRNVAVAGDVAWSMRLDNKNNRMIISLCIMDEMANKER